MKRNILFVGISLFFYLNANAESAFEARELSFGEKKVDTSVIADLVSDLQTNATIKECDISVQEIEKNKFLMSITPIDKANDKRSILISHGGFIDNLQEQSIYRQKMPGHVLRYEQESVSQDQVRNVLQVQKDYLLESRFGNRLISLIKIYQEKYDKNSNESNPFKWKEVYENSVLCVTDVKTIELGEHGTKVLIEPLNKSGKIYEGKISIGGE